MAAHSDPIAAIATAPGRGGIGVVRLSGAAIESFIQPLTGKRLSPRRATFSRFLDAEGGTLDEGIALYFPAPHSYTGESVLELQGHGGQHVLQGVLERCLELGARLAEPGEFSRRAFLNGKLDLVQAEAVADLIDAGSREAARSAMRSLDGEFSRRVNSVKDALIQLRMLVEATLDFPEEDVDFLQRADAWGKLADITEKLDAVLAQARQGALLREGLNVVLIGQPNVGKSSLLNRLAGYDAAIVTEIAGTTRDTVREAIQIQGVPLHIIDTAGLRETEDLVEMKGIERTWAALEKADVAVLLIDAKHGVGAQESAMLARMGGIPVLTVHNKIDLGAEEPHLSADGQELWLSAKTGLGIDILESRLLSLAGWQATGEGTFLARTRHVEALRRARACLQAAADTGTQLELLAEELRLGQEALSEITGEFSADDLLGVIFSQFCIGK
ncbi:MAG: tRNA uridine-5-carboxymethylaminomethyl(34) synthesis GTPase MnmE [Gammaproteobacteria bacterium]|nr:tRNA uridine-5-carboxymethylaminomethyl(34) synthesis GTPase MnmE [Gammaproteobacteria bacterium]